MALSTPFEVGNFFSPEPKSNRTWCVRYAMPFIDTVDTLRRLFSLSLFFTKRKCQLNKTKSKDDGSHLQLDEFMERNQQKKEEERKN